jgi:hypothetical protein
MIFVTTVNESMYTNIDPGSSACNCSVIGFNATLNPITMSWMLVTQLPFRLPLATSEGVHPMGPILDTVNFRIPKLYAVCK